MVTGATEFISIPEVRNKIDSVYPNPQKDVEKDLVVENSGFSHRLVGEAFEFLCKLYLYRQCEHIIRPGNPIYIDESGDGYRYKAWDKNTQTKYEWKESETPPVPVQRFDRMVWEGENSRYSSKEEWEEVKENLADWRMGSPIIMERDEDLTQIVSQYLETGMNAESVVRAALLNAGWKPDGSVKSWIDRSMFEDELLSEMEELFQELRSQQWASGDTLIESPSFGGHKHVLRGEGDFIIDNLLIDIKTTERKKFTNSFWRQILIYYTLCDIQRIIHDLDGRKYGDEKPKIKYPKINEIGIYYARFGELKSINMEEFISDNKKYENFRAWIVDRALEENEHKQWDFSDIREKLTVPYDYKQQRSLSDFK